MKKITTTKDTLSQSSATFLVWNFFSRPPIGRMSALYDNLVCREATLSPSFAAQLQWMRIESPWRSDGWGGCDSIVSCLKLIDYENRRNRKRKHNFMHRFVLMLSSLRMVAGAPARCLKWRGFSWSSSDWLSFKMSLQDYFPLFISYEFPFLLLPFFPPLFFWTKYPSLYLWLDCLFSTHWSWMYPWRWRRGRNVSDRPWRFPLSASLFLIF